MTKNESFDVAIVGGGVVGQATALEAAELGLNTVLILDAPTGIGSATLAAGAFFGVFSEVRSDETADSVELQIRERWASRQLYSGFLSRLVEMGAPPVFVRDGLFLITNAFGKHDSKELGAVRRAAKILDRPVEDVAPKDVPNFRPRNDVGLGEAVFLPDEGSVDTQMLLDSLSRALTNHPRVTKLVATAEKLNLFSGNVSIDLSSDQSIAAERVVLAGGSRVTPLLVRSGLQHLEVPEIFAGRGLSLLAKSDVKLEYPIRTPTRDFACGTHIVPRSQGIYVGATNQFCKTRARLNQLPVDDLQSLTHACAIELNIALDDAELMGIAIGYRPLTRDLLPLVGSTVEKRVVIASATYRNGVLLAPRIAQLIAEELLNPGALDRHPFSPRRKIETSDVFTQLSDVNRHNTLGN